MSGIIIYGDPRSTFCRSARMACVEKGVPHQLEPVELSSAAHRERHPFGKMPAMAHGDFKLFESSAIMRYVDEAFEGPSLQPGDVGARALMEQWVSANNDYIKGDLGQRYLLQYFMPKGPDGTPDRAAIDAALPDVAHHLGVFDGALADSAYFVGDTITLADLAVAPFLAYLHKVPEGPDLLADRANVRRWLETMAARPSFIETNPEVANTEAAE